MSGASTGEPELGPEEKRDLLAGEYVLGTLDPIEAHAVTDQAREDAALSAAIAAWQANLAPLSQLAAPVTPPLAVWNRIADSAGLPQTLHPMPSVALWRAFWDQIAVWRLATGTSLAAAVAMLLVVLVRPPAAPHHFAALLPAGATVSALLAEDVPGDGLILRPITSVAVASDRDLELWALSPGATQPVSLGVIPIVEQHRLIVPHRALRLTQHTKLMVSLEPKGGSATGQPTGPVLFAGSLSN